MKQVKQIHKEVSGKNLNIIEIDREDANYERCDDFVEKIGKRIEKIKGK